MCHNFSQKLNIGTIAPNYFYKDIIYWHNQGKHSKKLNLSIVPNIHSPNVLQFFFRISENTDLQENSNLRLI